MSTYRILLLGVLAVVLAACGNGEAPMEEPAEPAVGEENGSVEIDVVMGDIFYQPDSVEIPAGTILVVHAVNEGAIEHDFELDDGQGTGMVQPGEDATAELGPFDESTTAVCTVPGHEEAGMVFDITVTN